MKTAIIADILTLIMGIVLAIGIQRAFDCGNTFRIFTMGMFSTGWFAFAVIAGGITYYAIQERKRRRNK